MADIHPHDQPQLDELAHMLNTNREFAAALYGAMRIILDSNLQNQEQLRQQIAYMITSANVDIGEQELNVHLAGADFCLKPLSGRIQRPTGDGKDFTCLFDIV